MDDHEILILLNQKMDSVLETLKQLPRMEERISTLEKSDGIKQEQISTTKSEVEKLRSTNNIWNVVNSLGAIIAGVLGFSVK